MSRELRLRMSWVDVRAAEVHAVEVDVSDVPASRWRDRLLSHPPAQLPIAGSPLTVCGLRLPPRSTLDRDAVVTCVDCQQSDGVPSVLAEAERILRDARVGPRKVGAA